MALSIIYRHFTIEICKDCNVIIRAKNLNHPMNHLDNIFLSQYNNSLLHLKYFCHVYVPHIKCNRNYICGDL